MVCLPLVDVKFNFAVAVDTMGLFKSKYFLVRVRCHRRSRSCLGASLLATAACENRLFRYKIGSQTKEENLTDKNAQKL